MKVCISCGEPVEGKSAVKVKEDRIIRIIRIIKKSLGVAANNELYVCAACIPKQTDRRKSFEKNMMFASILAGLIIVILMAAIILSGKLDPMSFVSAFILAGFILLIQVFKYAPSMEIPPEPKMPIFQQKPSQLQPSIQTPSIEVQNPTKIKTNKPKTKK